MTIDIRTHAQHANAGYSLADTPDAVLFDYVDRFADTDEPTVMLAVLYPTGLDSDPRPCEGGFSAPSHDVPAGQPIIDIPDMTHCFMCPVHFHESASN